MERLIVLNKYEYLRIYRYDFLVHISHLNVLEYELRGMDVQPKMGVL